MEIVTYEANLFESISRQIHKEVESIRDPKKASIVGIYFNKDKDSKIAVQSEVIKTDGDIYRLLSDESVWVEFNQDEKQYHLLALLTAGWAAPVNKSDSDKDDLLPPSLHPERRRVKLTLVGNTSYQYGSVLSFDDEQEMLYDNMDASGALNDSFKEFLMTWRS